MHGVEAGVGALALIASFRMYHVLMSERKSIFICPERLRGWRSYCQ